VQHKGRPAAITGASTSAENKTTASLLRFIMRTRPVKIPAGALSGKRTGWAALSRRGRITSSWRLGR
jgi:hypothetical protein